MVRILIILIISANIAFGETADEVNAKAVAHKYIKAFQQENWKDLVGMMHPTTLKELRKAMTANWTSDSLSIQEQEEIAKMLNVDSLDEALKLSPEELYLRILTRASKNKRVKAVTKQKVKILDTKVKVKGEDFQVDIEMESEMHGRIYKATTHLLIEKVGDEYKVVSISKTKQ